VFYSFLQKMNRLQNMVRGESSSYAPLPTQVPDLCRVQTHGGLGKDAIDPVAKEWAELKCSPWMTREQEWIHTPVSKNVSEWLTVHRVLNKSTLSSSSQSILMFGKQHAIIDKKKRRMRLPLNSQWVPQITNTHASLKATLCYTNSTT
jgi:hypothetical protein